MARGKGKKRGQFLSRQGRTGGGGSTSVESSSRFSEDMQCPVASAVGPPTRGKGKKRTPKQYGSAGFSRDNYCEGRMRTGETSSSAEDAAAEIDTPAEKPGKKLLKKTIAHFVSVFVELRFFEIGGSTINFAHLFTIF